MKYSVDLRQFNNNEKLTVSFVVFEQAVNYALLKLKESVENDAAIIKAITIKGPKNRKIVVLPTTKDLDEPTMKEKRKVYYRKRLLIELGLTSEDEGYFLF